jgi:hypothetical protein
VQRLKRVGALSFAKMQGAVMGVIGLLFGLIYGAILVVMGIVALVAGQKAGIMLLAGGVAFVILAPLFYAALGFLFGALSAWIYNIVARYVGGIEVEFE